MSSKKIIRLGTLGLVTVIAGGFLLATSVSADEGESFGGRVRGMFMSVEEREDHQIEVQEKLQQLVDSGELTQEQLDLHEAVIEAHNELREERLKQLRTDMVEKLNENGFNVSDEDLKSLRETMRELGFGRKGVGKGERMGRGNRECADYISE